MKNICTSPLVRGLALLVTVGVLTAAPVQRPELRHTVRWLETSWFGAPAIYDLDRDGRPELVGTYYSIFVWDSEMNLLDEVSYETYHKGRIYAPAVVADLQNDGITEIVVGGSQGMIAAYEWRNGHLSIKAGWPYRSYDGAGMSPEVRSLAGADLDHDGTIEIIAANTQTDEGEPQVYVLSPNGTLYQPPGIAWQAWPRYNTATGPGNDTDANGAGNHGYGCYGLNLGVGNLDDDPALEIVVTFDNHQINVFDHDGVSHLASDYYRNRATEYHDNRLNWGQMIRWFDPAVETQHYHEHLGSWPSPADTPWCQWTASPCNVVDLNGDGRNEVVGVPNVELHIPYETIHHSVMALEGSYGDGSRSARRVAGWEYPPSSDAPLIQSQPWYPPPGIPAPTTVDLTGDGRPEILVPMNDGHVYAFGPDAARLWRYDIRHGAKVMYASEVLVCDLNQDNADELIFTTYGDPESVDPGVPHGYLVVLDRQGGLLHDVELPIQGTNGNGKGAPAAPTLGDLDGDGALEVVVQTFDGNCFVYSVPGAATNSLSWPTARGSYLRQGRTTSSETEPRPTILDITVTGSSATIDWKAAPQRRQSLECSDDLGAAAPVWIVLQTYEPPTNVTNRFVDTPLRDARYYRVRAE